MHLFLLANQVLWQVENQRGKQRWAVRYMYLFINNLISKPGSSYYRYFCASFGNALRLNILSNYFITFTLTLTEISQTMGELKEQDKEEWRGCETPSPYPGWKEGDGGCSLAG